MKRLLLAMIASLCLLACSKHNYHTVKTTKPRLHKGWYKDHKNFKHVKVWRIHIPLFEKQGTKVVKMKG